MPDSYDERYDIRIANRNDIQVIMQFIDVYWKKDHIMAKNRELFEYEFLEDDGTVNFVLAIDKQSGNIEGVIGFLKASHDSANLDVWSSIWKVREGNMGMLGVEIYSRYVQLSGCRYDLGVGYNLKTAIPLAKVILKRRTAKMKHYYMLAERDEFKIARIQKKISKKDIERNYNVIRLNSIEEVRERFDYEQYKNNVPYKDLWYINHRFFDYPIHKYEVYGIENENHVVNTLFVLRKQLFNNRVAVRLVDCIGDYSLLCGTNEFFKTLLKNSDYEYVDFYCLGVLEDSIEKAGFELLTEDGVNIIPNYFNPFVQENTDIWISSSADNAVFTKADADQDRPN